MGNNKLTNVYVAAQFEDSFKRVNKSVHSLIDHDDLFIDTSDTIRGFKFGLEEDSHVTIMYSKPMTLPQGVDHLKISKDISALWKQSFLSKSNTAINGVSLFENEKFDVLKFDIQSAHFKSIRDYMKNKWGIEATYDEYKPHMTIAYLKSGMGEKYISRIYNNESLLYRILNAIDTPKSLRFKNTHTHLDGEVTVDETYVHFV